MFALACQAHTSASLLSRRGARVTSRGAAAPRRAVVAMAGKKDSKPQEEEEENNEPKIDMAGLSQLIKMGLGTISGDIKEINLDDPTRTVVMELEANNFEDADGNPLNFMNNEVGVFSCRMEFYV